jgi:hypothetical protein
MAISYILTASGYLGKDILRNSNRLPNRLQAPRVLLETLKRESAASVVPSWEVSPVVMPGSPLGTACLGKILYLQCLKNCFKY